MFLLSSAKGKNHKNSWKEQKGKFFRAVSCLCESAICPKPFRPIHYSLSFFHLPLPILSSSFTDKKKHLNRDWRPWPLKYRAKNLPRLMGVIDLFDTLWIYEAASQVWESNKAQLWANKQVAIHLDTSQSLRRTCLSSTLAMLRKSVEFNWNSLVNTQSSSDNQTLAGFHII